MERQNQANDPSGQNEAPRLRRKALVLSLLAMRHGMADVEDILDLVEHWQDGEPLTFRVRIMKMLKLTETRYKVLESFYEEYKLQGDSLEDELSTILTNLSQTRNLREIKAQPLVMELAAMGPDQVGPEPTPTVELHHDFEARVSFKSRGVVGMGGQGIVYKAFDNGLLREIAIKSLKKDFSDPSKTRFRREAKYLASLQHPGVLPIYLFGDEAGENPFIAMRLLPGRTFHSLIREYHQAVNSGKISKTEQSLQFRDLIRNLVQICQTIDYAHSVDIIHRDLKPVNIMIGEHGEAFVIDWGLARRVNSKNDAPDDDGQKPGARWKSSSISDTNGTPEYMAPEQARGEAEKQDERTDIFGLGGIFYLILTNMEPFRGTLDNSSFHRAIEYDLKKPSDVIAGVDPALEKICMKAMEEKPASRYASVKDLIDDLNRWLADEPVSVHPDSIVRKFSRWSARHRTLVASLFSIFTVTLISLAILAIIFYGEEVKTANALTLAIENQKKADQNFNDALNLAADSFETLSSLLPNTPGIGTRRFEMAKSLALRYDRMRQENPENTKLLPPVIASFRETANAAMLINLAEADTFYLQAINLAMLYFSRPDHDESKWTDMPHLWMDYAQRLRTTNRHEDARERLEDVGEMLQSPEMKRVAESSQWLLWLHYWNARSELLLEMGNLGAAESIFDSATKMMGNWNLKQMELQQDFQKFLFALELGKARLLELQNALAASQESYAFLVDKLPGNMVDPDLRFLRGVVLNRYLDGIATNKILFMRQTQKINEANRLLTDLRAGFLPSMVYDEEHARSVLNSVSLLVYVNDYARAETLLRLEIQMLADGLVKQDQVDPRSTRGRLYEKLAELLQARSKPDEATEVRKLAIHDHEKVLNKLPQRKQDREALERLRSK